MSLAWSAEQLASIGAADDLEIAAQQPGGSRRRWTRIWVVIVDGHVYVRTWHRRKTGWFGDVVASRRAGARVPGVEASVTIEDVGIGTAELREGIDAAYRAKYGRYGAGSVDQMVSEDAAASTLRLDPE